MSLREEFEKTEFARIILERQKVWFCDSVDAYSGQGNDYFLINGGWVLFQELKK